METDKILELYKRLAPAYEEIYGEEQRRKYWLISSQVGERVADAGCGVGLVFEVVSAYVVCVDISLDMLAQARAKRGELGEVVAADFWRPPFRDNSFDTVLFLSSVESELYERAYEVWRNAARKAVFEFRGEWRIFEQRK
ncbi:MAG: class I SAM-dependent methyltransferase [Pyrobaculum sp.]|nr:class I SAM-dependent methyltransferase [Pyrobaculum sp.]